LARLFNLFTPGCTVKSHAPWLKVSMGEMTAANSRYFSSVSQRKWWHQWVLCPNSSAFFFVVLF